MVLVLRGGGRGGGLKLKSLSYEGHRSFLEACVKSKVFAIKSTSKNT